eukprot:scaffold92998_cov61-Phaeocystis_antarctica.AAC.2
MFLALLESTDVATLVLGHLDTTSMVALGRTSRGVRAAQRFTIRNSPQLLVAAASNGYALTKGQLTGWFALSSTEADQLPRTRHKRRAGGHYFLYRQPAFEGVLGVHLTDALAWEVRLELRRRLDTRKRHAERGQTRRIAACR